MKVHHTLICFFFLSLQDGNTEVTDEKFLIYGVPGGNVTAGFGFNSPGTWKMFCREKCEGENILINTTDDIHQRGRYRMEYRYDHSCPCYVFSVSISELTTSDSGQYRCVLGGSSSSSSYIQFGVVVAEALLDGNDDQRKKHFYKEAGSSLTVGCYFKDSGSRKMFCRGECGGDEVLIQTQDEDAHTGRYRIGSRQSSGGGLILYVSITQLSSSDSGQYRCSLDQTSFRDFEITVTDAVVSPSPTFSGATEQPEEASAATGVPLYVIVSLLVFIVLSSLAALIICIKRKSSRGLRTRGNSEGTDMENVHYENCTPGSACEDSTYQSLHPASRDLDQTYSALTHHT